jgi:hypothetical protein
MPLFDATIVRAKNGAEQYSRFVREVSPECAWFGFPGWVETEAAVGLVNKMG